ncbi:kynurenine/alpha-aminoadipate aminotransferase, mitochondrial-like [Frieseomelitta varia]|uniref:kynurenine/alpha-aminoadipate aminotransferase, mitochondrial-like n=1 Tax=Frieseomelitta varia TaxID=561572 RepID=UPI001CB6A864|nr:kynurenine/alpha-aminoadipate aminotransferase, mitochondrial-like [Frieseomelitta varia]
MDFTPFITKKADRRQPSVTWLYSEKFAEQKNALNLAKAMPDPSTLPFVEISVTCTGGKEIKLIGKELAWSLQYAPSQGYLPLLKKIREFQEHWHKPIYNDWDTVLTCGSMEGCSKVFEMVLENGDPMMAQVPTYDGVLGVLIPLEPEFIGIEQDEDGIIPANIAKVCEERRRSGKPMPKILYVNPTGGNPTGTVLTDSRKRQIYELAETYNFLILEDDPYSFVHFLDKAPATFLELDTKGRVIRLDSISKVISPGLRLGVVTGHKEIIKRLTAHMETTSIHPSSLSCCCTNY